MFQSLRAINFVAGSAKTLSCAGAPNPMPLETSLAKQPPADAPTLDPDVVAEIFADIALEAAVAVMKVYASESHPRRKPDRSPVCDADEFAETIILERLGECLPDLPVLAEEAAAQGKKTVSGSTFILVDPVDGTREFLSHNGEFTINIALIVNGEPHAGVVYAPALERLWIAGGRATSCKVAPGASLPPPQERRPVRVRPAPADGLVVMASRSHGDAETEAFLADLPVRERRAAGSSLKFCIVAEGEADVYPRFGQTMEWDTAAGDAVLRAAGGVVLDRANRRLQYGKVGRQFKNGPFVAWGDPKAARF